MITQIYHFIKNYKTLILFIAFYCVVLFFGHWITEFHNLKNSQFRILFPQLPFYIFALAGIISLIFNNSACFFLSIINCWLYYFFLYEPVLKFNVLFINDYKFLSALLIPFNYLLFSLFQERGFFNIHGLKKIIFIFAEFIFPLFLLSKPDNPVHRFITSYYKIMKKIILFRTLNFTILDLTVLTACLFFMTLLISSKNKFKLKFYIASLLVVFYLFQSGLKLKYGNIYPTIVSFTFFINGIIFFFLSISAGYEKAYKDELTQVFGRRALNEEFAKLYGKYSIAMIDIDHFKKFNDTYGHKAGDTVLYSIAQMIESHASGKTFRYGGEEFTIIYKNGNLKKIYKELDYIRKIISKSKINIGKNKTGKKENKVAVTISVGLAEKETQSDNPNDTLSKADEYLYKAKENGRNRVETDFNNIQKKG